MRTVSRYTNAAMAISKMVVVTVASTYQPVYGPRETLETTGERMPKDEKSLSILKEQVHRLLYVGTKGTRRSGRGTRPWELRILFTQEVV